MKRIFACFFPCYMFSLLYFAGSSYCWAESIAVIVNQANSAGNLTTPQVARIYRGQQQYWPDGKEIVIVNRPTDSAIRKAFYQEVLECSPTQKFYQPGSPIPLKTIVQESVLATIRFVSNMPEAVGYVYLSELDKANKEIKVVRVIEVQTDDDGGK